ncbi:MAG: DNA mismatch endonuclease Vsr [Armatimonadetes bacterium]|nr:DNA mismatch endonuclease Vsr [Armatimonadota bacterium]
MADTLSKEQRSVLMSKVRGADTKPEWILRCGLHRLGLRYRLRNKHLPGNPDLAFPRHGTVVFVHGCFWHRHAGCKDASMPKGNQSFWTRKFAENTERDARAVEALERQGWNVLVVWECDLMKRTVETIQEAADAIRGNRRDPAPPQYRQPTLERKDLLAVAEGRVRYRIDK